MARFTELSAADIKGIAQTFALGPVTSFEPLDAGTINSNFRLDTERGRFFLRINEGKRREDVVYETRLVEGLASAGVATPLPESGADGERFAEFRGKWLSVFPWIDGEHRARNQVSPDDAAALGTTLRSFHDAAAALDMPARSGLYTFEKVAARVEGFRDNPDSRIQEALPLIDDELAWQRQRTVDLHSRRGIIHGDLFRDNVLWKAGRISALIDFEQASDGVLLYDLAVCINAWCYDEHFDEELIRALVRGYLGRVSNAPSGELLAQARWAALRFSITRITDVYLVGERKPDKDFGRYLSRLHALRDHGLL